MLYIDGAHLASRRRNLHFLAACCSSRLVPKVKIRTQSFLMRCTISHCSALEKTTIRRKSKPLLVNQFRAVIKKVLNHCLVIKTEPKHDHNIVRLTIIRAWIMTIKSPSNELNQTLESLSWPPWFSLSAALRRVRGVYGGDVKGSLHFFFKNFEWFSEFSKNVWNFWILIKLLKMLKNFTKFF